jgi:CDP-4-dehydro-6-deoxyglucose reductase
MSEYWFNRARLNDLLRIHGPLGTFFLRKTAGIDLYFLATGTGIAPVKSILESLNEVPVGEAPNSVTVIWGGRRAEDFYLDVRGIPGNFDYVPVQSRALPDWKGAKGYVQEELLRSKRSLSNAAVYACGSNEMICSAKAALTLAGLATDRFYSDAFVSSGSVDNSGRR